ncbi:MAG: hypothetical protein R3234_03275 [Thermoanaerobaculia bacterium]|nr:hypothetical protein [Thermoanaerobaculia bacterium]
MHETLERKPGNRRLPRFAIPLAVLLGLGLGVATAGFLPAPAVPFYLGGIQVNEPDLRSWVSALQREGLNTVAVTDYARQGDWDSTNLWWEVENDPWVLQEIRTAEAQGLHTVLVLRVALDHAFERNRFLWHGQILPTSEAARDEWFRRYGEFVTTWARTAQREGVDLLMIASEMNALTSTAPLRRPPELAEYFLDPAQRSARKELLLSHRDRLEDGRVWLAGRKETSSLEDHLEARIGTERDWAARTSLPSTPDRLARLNRRRSELDERWRNLIAAVRDEYAGEIGYAANFDQYRQVGFWDALDVIGINAYFPLRNPDSVGVEGDPELLRRELERGWTRILEEIARFRVSRGLDEHPVVFTELGYVPRSRTTLAPWAGEGYSVVYDGNGTPRVVVWAEQPRDRRERALAVEALHAGHRAYAEPFLRGSLYWQLSTVPSHAEIEPFVLLLNPGRDPLLDALRLFRPGGERPGSLEAPPDLDRSTASDG